MIVDEDIKAIEKVIVDIVEDLIQDWGLDIDDGLCGNTTLVKDLEFASVDIIQLCVAIEEYYNKKIGFQNLLMVNGCYVSDLSIKQIADFIFDKI